MDILHHLINFLPAIIVLGFLIFVHELGHFLAARKVGIRVEVFSLGFGPRLVGTKRGDTDYRISLIPLGGYVKMAGEAPGEGAGHLDELQSKSVPQRFFVFVAGAGMNAITAVVLTSFLAFIGLHVPAYILNPPVIAWVLPDSPADKAGFLPGDRILSIDDNQVDTWESALTYLSMNPEHASIFRIKRQQEIISLTFQPGGDFGSIPLGGITCPSKVIINSVNNNSPAEKAGMQPYDEIVEVNGHPIKAIEQLMYLVNHSNGKNMSFLIKRNNMFIRMDIAPKFNETASRYLIGITFSAEKVLRKYNLLESVRIGFTRNYEMSKTMFIFMGQLISGKASVKNLGGPIMIGVMAKEAAQSGLRDLLSLTSFISLNLAILNLLPIPILDGGLILFLLLEAIRRKPVSEHIQIVVQNIFFLLLISFALLITYNDIIRLFNF